jgi:hypothetical protein
MIQFVVFYNVLWLALSPTERDHYKTCLVNIEQGATPDELKLMEEYALVCDEFCAQHPFMTPDSVSFQVAA